MYVRTINLQPQLLGRPLIVRRCSELVLFGCDCTSFVLDCTSFVLYCTSFHSFVLYCTSFHSFVPHFNISPNVQYFPILIWQKWTKYFSYVLHLITCIFVLFRITRLRLSQQLIKNRLFMKSDHLNSGQKCVYKF